MLKNPLKCRNVNKFKEESLQEAGKNSHWGLLLILGSVWGLSEAALGMGLRSCAAFVSGSLMTGAALLFLAAGWVLSRRILGLFFMVLLASFFKMFDALLLSLPLKHGAIGNPIFAFFMEAAAFVFFVWIIREKLIQKAGGQALLGGLSAVLAVNLFPLVRFATGIPACVAPGTGYPLSLYYIPIAVAVSAVCVPVGFWLGEKMGFWENRLAGVRTKRRLDFIFSPATLVVCLIVIALLRIT